MSWQNKKQIKQEAIDGEFRDGTYIYKSSEGDGEPVIVKIFDDGVSTDLMVVELWDGVQLGNECYLHTYPEHALFLRR